MFKFLLAYWVLPSCIKCHQIWLGRSEVSLVVNLVFHFSSFRIWLGFSWFYWVLPSITGFFSIAARCERVSLVSSECCVFFYCFKKKKQIDWKKRGTIIELFPGFFVRVRPNRPPISASTCIDGSSEGCEGWKKKRKRKKRETKQESRKSKKDKMARTMRWRCLQGLLDWPLLGFFSFHWVVTGLFLGIGFGFGSSCLLGFLDFSSVLACLTVFWMIRLGFYRVVDVAIEQPWSKSWWRWVGLNGLHPSVSLFILYSVSLSLYNSHSVLRCFSEFTYLSWNQFDLDFTGFFLPSFIESHRFWEGFSMFYLISLNIAVKEGSNVFVLGWIHLDCLWLFKIT